MVGSPISPILDGGGGVVGSSISSLMDGGGGVVGSPISPLMVWRRGCGGIIHQPPHGLEEGVWWDHPSAPSWMEEVMSCQSWLGLPVLGDQSLLSSSSSLTSPAPLSSTLGQLQTTLDSWLMRGPETRYRWRLLLAPYSILLCLSRSVSDKGSFLMLLDRLVTKRLLGIQGSQRTSCRRGRAGPGLTRRRHCWDVLTLFLLLVCNFLSLSGRQAVHCTAAWTGLDPTGPDWTGLYWTRCVPNMTLKMF